MNNFIAHVGLSKKEKNQIMHVISKSNLILKKYHEKINQEKNKINRVDFFSKIIKKFKKMKDVEKKNNIIFPGLRVFNIEIPRSDLEQIEKTKFFEWKIVQANLKMIKKLSQKWSGAKFKDCCLDFENIQSEAFTALLNSIPYYTDTSKELSTFFYNCINRHLCRFCNKTNGLSNIPDDLIKLKMRYDNVSKNEGSNFDSIVEQLRLSQKEIFNLCCVFNNVKNLSSIQTDENHRYVESIDTMYIPDFESSEKIMQIISKIEFSDLEKAVLKGVLQSSSNNGNLGLNHFSKKLINPKTKKPYSRMAFSLAWKKIKTKIKKEYKKVA